ncbi:MAG: phenylacetate--CoA ligase family protein, partial [Paraclostridium sp.]|uniref:phenylacetate--CoA ligase family protein n=1 Tax=Paraclostridium sp. TaxID=2023273 RepID=UPI003F3601AB
MSLKEKIIRIGQGYLNVEKTYGKQFKDMYNFLEKSQWLDEETQKENQLEQLKKTIINAYENVPYYKELFDSHDIDAYQIKDFKDIKKIPYLTKDIIRENLDKLYNINYPKYKIEHKITGGSTGVPMGLYQDKFYTRKVEQAFVSQMWSRVGYKQSEKNKIVYLRGINIKGEYEKNGKHLVLNSFLLTQNNFKNYIKHIEKFNPDFINGYPSSLYILANYIIDSGIRIRVPSLKAILLTSENIYDFQRNTIEKAFGKRTYSFYGHTERCCIGGECEESRSYHLQSEYGYTELINSKGEDSEAEGELVEIVCTGFINPVMPFIRYRTQDIAVNTLDKCTCGRNYKLIKKVEGRAQDFIFDKEGNVRSFTCQDEPLWEVKQKITAYQYNQSEYGVLSLNIQSNESFNRDEIKSIKDSFINIFKGFDLEIQFVDKI